VSVIDISKITLKNFLSYGNKKQEFVPKGLTFITGFNPNNDRKNYTGKSSLLKSIPFSLFGQVDGITKSRLINWKNRKNLETEVFFNKNSNEYVISRGIKPDYLKVTENGKELPTPPDKRTFQKEIEEDLLQMSYSTFMNTVYADNNNTSSILTLSKPQKRNFLEQMFDLQYYTRVKENANKRILEIKKQIDDIEKGIEYKSNEIVSLKEQIDDYESALRNLTDSGPELKEKKEKLKIYGDKYEEFTNKYNTLMDDIDKLNNDINKMEKIKDKFLNKIKSLETIYTKKDISPIDTEELEKSIKNKKIFVLEDLQKKKYENITYSDKHKKDVINEKAEVSAKIKILTNEISDIKNGTLDTDTCPACLQPVDHKLIESVLTEKKNEKGKELRDLKDKLKKLTQEADKIEENESIRKHNEKIDNDISKLEIEIEREENKLERANEVQESYRKKQKYEKVIKKLSEFLDSYTIHISNINKNIIELKEKEKKFDVFFDTYNKLKNEIDILKDKVISEREEKQRIVNWISKSKENYLYKNRQIEKDKTYIEEQNELLDYYKVLKNLTADEEAKQYTISNKVPLLNKRVNHYLNKAGVNFYTKIDSWLETEIRGPGIKDCSFENLSGAERVSIDRALAYSFHDISKLQSPTYLNLMVLDEIIGSSALDAIGLQNLMNIVKVKQMEDNLNVLVVSHSTEILENTDNYFDNKYCVVFDGGYSKIEKMD